MLQRWMTLQNPLTHSNRIESRQITTRNIELRHLGDLFRIAYYVDINPHLLSRSLNILMSIRIEITKKRAHVTQQYEAVSYWSSRTGDVSRTPPGCSSRTRFSNFHLVMNKNRLWLEKEATKKGFFWSHCGRICLKVNRFRCQIFGGCLEDHPRTDVSSLQRMVIVSPLARVIPVPNGPNGLSMGLTK